MALKNSQNGGLYNNMSKYKKNLGCEWYDLKKGKKLSKPFAITTTATSDLICALAQEYDTVIEIYNHINYDEDAKRVLKYMIDKGYGNEILRN